MNKNLLVPLLIAIIAIAIFVVVSLTLTAVLAFIPGMIITYIIYLNTFFKKVPQPDSILPLYLVLLGIQFIHFTEEYLTDFNIAVPLSLRSGSIP